ncbi:MAG: lipoyl(octanoyl) transferase LipB [Clostridia bacterium]|nr:lipoyl(octanoyl) transferase LipB [Clostridia bacterium]
MEIIIMVKCRVLDLGLVSYEKAYDLQRKLHKFRREGRIDDVLILLEHEPVVTMGRGGKRDNILVSDELLQSKGIRVFEIDRGGDVTLHCPGQLVGYPILDLKIYGKNIHRYLRNLEEVIIRSLKVYGINGQRIENHTGVWVGGRKVASIGIGIKGWVTFHGFALNINSDLSYFSLIRPCGFESRMVTSMSEILGRSVEPKDFRRQLIEQFREVFNLQMEEHGKQVSTLDSKEIVSCSL